MQQFHQPPSPFHPSQLHRHRQQQQQQHQLLHHRHPPLISKQNAIPQSYPRHQQHAADINFNGNPNNNGNAFDITLIAQGERFPANRAFLCESSIMFEQMLRRPRLDSEGKEIVQSEEEEDDDDQSRGPTNSTNSPSELDLPNMRKDHLRPILDFLYTDSVDICCIGYALSLCVTAQRYLLEDMVEVLEDYILEECVSPSMALSLYRYADAQGLTELKHELTLRICADLLGHSIYPAFSRLDIRHVEELVRHEVADVVDVEDDFDLVEVIAHWIRPDNYMREQDEAADWLGTCSDCGRVGTQVWGNVENISRIETDRKHYEERLFRNLNLDLFNHHELLELHHVAREFNLDIVAQKTIDFAQKKR